MNSEYLSGPELKYNRLRLDIKQKDLAAVCGWSSNRISLIEKFAVVSDKDYDKYVAGLLNIVSDPDRKHRIEGIKDFIVEYMAKSGLSLEQLSTKFGVSKYRIRLAMRKHNMFELWQETQRRKKVQEFFLEDIDI